MTTLMEITTPDGLRRRCHAECYNATGHACNCICHGMNHGAGLQKAVHNTRRYWRAWLKLTQLELGPQQPLTAVVDALHPIHIQRSLFPPEDLIV